ncbi:PqqD family protein [Janibacter hoylei]|uniref:PqqD family protein n=1 Tax=Janibacter hoylei TaxID=364298 RepID=UPI00248FFFB2|nr:PqqD family protein [Janibacter hoylei]
MDDLVVADGVIVDDRGEDVRLIPPASADIVLLTGSGAETWRAITDRGRVSAAIDLLSTTFDVPRAQLARDVQPYLHDLESFGILVRTAGGAT